MKVRLREIRESDLTFLNTYRNKHSVSKHLNLYFPKNIESERDWFLKQKDEIHFLIEAENNLPIGQVSLINFINKEKVAEFTIFIDDKYWGKSYGTIATKLMLYYAFTELNLHKIFLHVYEGNERAKRMYESIGFIQEGFMRDFVFKGGKYISAYFFGILSSEFLTKTDLSGIIEPLAYDDKE